LLSIFNIACCENFDFNGQIPLHVCVFTWTIDVLCYCHYNKLHVNLVCALTWIDYIIVASGHCHETEVEDDDIDRTDGTQNINNNVEQGQ